MCVSTGMFVYVVCERERVGRMFVHVCVSLVEGGSTGVKFKTAYEIVTIAPGISKNNNDNHLSHYLAITTCLELP